MACGAAPPRGAPGTTPGARAPPGRSLGYYAGAEIPTGQQLRCVTNGTAGVRLMATDALLNPAGLRLLASSSALITSAAQDSSQLPASGQRFLRAFRQRYHRTPGRYAAYGYEAMAVVLDSIRRAGDSGDDRDSVLSAFFEITDRDSIL